MSDARPRGRPGLPVPRPMAPGVTRPPMDPKDREPMTQIHRAVAHLLRRLRSTPARAAPSVSGRSKSATTSSAPARWRSVAREASWTMARTRTPAASSAWTTKRPFVPVAPVTTIICGLPHRRLRSRHSTAQLDNLPLAQHLHLDGIAAFEVPERVSDPLTARVVDHRDADRLENDVAPEDQLGPRDRGPRRAPADADHSGRRAIGDALDEQAARLRQIEHPGQLVGEEQGRHARPERWRFQEHPAGHLRGHHEAQPLEASRFRDNMAHDPDDSPLHVEHWPARVPLV